MHLDSYLSYRLGFVIIALLLSYTRPDVSI